jgi:hypothetical protein
VIIEHSSCALFHRFTFIVTYRSIYIYRMRAFCFSDGRLLEGDQILAIDGQPLDSNISHEQAISILQKARGLVELVVARSAQGNCDRIRLRIRKCLHFYFYFDSRRRWYATRLLQILFNYYSESRTDTYRLSHLLLCKIVNTFVKFRWIKYFCFSFIFIVLSTQRTLFLR